MNHNWTFIITKNVYVSDIGLKIQQFLHGRLKYKTLRLKRRMFTKQCNTAERMYEVALCNLRGIPDSKAGTLYTVLRCYLFSWRYNPLWLYFHSPVAGFSLPVFRGFLITYNDAPQSVELLWTRDKSVAETSTWQHTTVTTDKHPCPRWDSNPQSQQASGRRPL
jgi:hypothetical protein